MNEFLITLFTVFIAKLKTSGDDLIWLPPYVKKDRLKSSSLYLFAITAVVFLSWLTVFTATSLIPQKEYISLVGSIALILFSLFVIKKNDESTGPQQQAGHRNVLLISLIGSVDEFFLFSVLFSSGLYSLSSVILGTFLAGIVVILFSMGLNTIKIFVTYTEKVKPWIVVFFIGIATLAYSIYDIIQINSLSN